MVEASKSYNSRQFQIAALLGDARILLDHCFGSGGEVHSVVTEGQPYWKHSSPQDPPALDVESARTQKWLVRFGEVPKKAYELSPTIELLFQGIWSEGQGLMLKPGRVYCSMISMEDPRARECWLGLETIIKKTYAKNSVPSLSPRGKPTRSVTYVGPAAQVWLAEPHHSLGNYL